MTVWKTKIRKPAKCRTCSPVGVAFAPKLMFQAELNLGSNGHGGSEPWTGCTSPDRTSLFATIPVDSANSANSVLRSH